MAMRVQALLCAAAVLLACGGDWMTGLGTPVELSHETLRGQWVHTRSVLTMAGNPSVEIRREFSLDEGSIIEFDGAGGLQLSRYVLDGPFPTEYSISGDSLTMMLLYRAEVSTSRLILTNREFSYDFDGDGDAEAGVSVDTYQKGKD
jgi:hypothetical protein